MADRRLVQCFGVYRRPRKPEKPCRKRFIWSAQGATRANFGSNGSTCCPRCGTTPDFRHPFNRYLDGEISEAEAKSRMPEYIELLQSENNS